MIHIVFSFQCDFIKPKKFRKKSRAFYFYINKSATQHTHTLLAFYYRWYFVVTVAVVAEWNAILTHCNCFLPPQYNLMKIESLFYIKFEIQAREAHYSLVWNACAMYVYNTHEHIFQYFHHHFISHACHCASKHTHTHTQLRLSR